MISVATLKHFALFILFPAAAGAAGHPPVEGLYGPEFTFTDNGSVTEYKKTEYVAHLRRHLVDNQPRGAKFSTGPTSEKFISPNGWWFEITTNPGVLEIKMSPLTVEQTRRFKADIQDAIFVSAANVGLFAWDYLGGGHMNFDTRIFGNRVLLARNFIVDFWNHSELSMGIFSFDTNNALPLQFYNDDTIAEVRAVIARADAGEFQDTPDGVATFLSQVNAPLAKTVSTVLGRNATGKYHDLNAGHGGRIEIRALRPQTSMDVWLNQIELIEKRINNHLRFIDKPIPFKFRLPVPDPWVIEGIIGNQLYVPPINPQKALRAFHQYVSESGLEWKNHRGYIWPPWIQSGELEKFEASEEFMKLERQSRQKRLARTLTCAGSLALRAE